MTPKVVVRNSGNRRRTRRMVDVDGAIQKKFTYRKVITSVRVG